MLHTTYLKCYLQPSCRVPNLKNLNKIYNGPKKAIRSRVQAKGTGNQRCHSVGHSQVQQLRQSRQLRHAIRARAETCRFCLMSAGESGTAWEWHDPEIRGSQSLPSNGDKIPHHLTGGNACTFYTDLIRLKRRDIQRAYSWNSVPDGTTTYR